MSACKVMGALLTPKLLDAKFLDTLKLSLRSLGDGAFCSPISTLSSALRPSPAGSSLTYTERSAAHAPWCVCRVSP